MPTARIEETIDGLLFRYGLGRISGEPALVGRGTLNWNYRVETDRGPLFVRRHRPDLCAERIREEHALLRWMAERELPVHPPLADLDGQTVSERDGCGWAVFPWITGAPPVRGAIKMARAEAIGAMHGRIHLVLSRHPGSAEPFTAPEFNIRGANERLRDLLRAAETAKEAAIASTIRLQIQLLEAHGSEQYRLDSVPNSLSHGDYHDQQILFAPAGEVGAVVDWEMFGMRPRVFEVLRSLSFSQLLGRPGAEAYLAGYARHARLDPEHCRAGVELWWQSRLQGTWAYQAFLTEGNTRVAEFFPAMRAELLWLSDSAWRARLGERMAEAVSRASLSSEDATLDLGP